MSRKRRVKVDGGVYHIINKINEDKNLLKEDHVKFLILKVIKEAKFKKKFRFRLKNITIMDNHLHLLIKMRSGEDLSKVMQWIFSVFAMRFNRMFNRHGHLWIGRFKSVLITTIRAYKAVFEYICNNPVKAGLVKSAEEYRFGYLWLCRDRAFASLFD